MSTLPADLRERLNESLDLLTHHWHSIEDTLLQGLPVGPLLLEDRSDATRGQAWGRGFLRGVDVHRDRWDDLINDPMRRAALTPMIALAGDANAANGGRRADLLTDATFALSFLFHHFRPTTGVPVAAGYSALH